MAIILVQSDFENIGLVAKHCNLPKLDIAINEAILFDLKPLVCDLYHDLNANWEITNGSFSNDFSNDFDNEDLQDSKWRYLIYPLNYIGCNDKNKSHQGLKDVLIRYAYARYVLINNFDDTPSGGVTKNNQWSIPKPFSDIKQISDRYRSMAFYNWKEIENYLCLNRYEYDFISDNCTSCGCNGDCSGDTKTKGYGIKGSNITK